MMLGARTFQEHRIENAVALHTGVFKDQQKSCCGWSGVGEEGK